MGLENFSSLLMDLHPFLWCRGEVVQRADAGVVMSNPARDTIKIPLARYATGDHLIKSISLEKTQSFVSGFCYA